MEKDGKRKLGMFLTLLVDITRWIICFAGAIVRLKSRRWRDGGALREDDQQAQGHGDDAVYYASDSKGVGGG